MTASLIITCVLISPLVAAPPATSEPTNAAEAAAKKAAADKLVDGQYAAWVSTLPAEQQAWERVLQENRAVSTCRSTSVRRLPASLTPGISSKTIPTFPACC